MSIWIGFNAFVIVLLLIDLLVFNRKPHRITIKESLTWTAIWIALGVSFSGVIYVWMGPEASLDYLTGYLIEKSLSVDNIFVFLIIFQYFSVPDEYQHKVLFWGILGALIFRFLFIFAGVALIERFFWVKYLFGAFLIYSGIKLVFRSDDAVRPEKNPFIKWLGRAMPVTLDFHGEKFFIRKRGLLTATPMLVVLIVIETTDVVFALDSIPAILAITRDPFLVYSSNVFAILGLRALYFAVAGLLGLFHYLDYGLAVVLSFVGLKMIGEEIVHISTGLSLGIIGLVLSASILLSWFFPKKEN